MTLTPERTVREIAIENPASVRVFESFGIDYCCGGKRSLKDACAHANVAEESVRKQLENLDSAQQDGPADWTHAPFAELTGHIVNHHHEFVRRESARLSALLEKVNTRHGQGHPELAQIKAIFEEIAHELSMHMQKEERVLFPYLNAMDAAVSAGKATPPSLFGTVRNPIGNMLADHDDAGALLARMSELSGRYQAPPDACPSFKGLYHGLEEFERDLHQHVHLENNILFPRALEMEKTQDGKRAA